MRLGFNLALGATLAALALGRPPARGYLPLNPTPADIASLSKPKASNVQLGNFNVSDSVSVRALISVPITCRIQVKNGTSGPSMGYISQALNEWGEYGTLQSTTTNALRVRFDYDLLAAETSRLSLTIVGGNTAYPMFGGIMGFSSDESNNMGAGSYNYAYIGGTASTPADSPPVSGANTFDATNDFGSKIESAIWKYTRSTKRLVPHWVNTDQSTSTGYIMYAADQKTFAITGDRAAFANMIGLYPEVTFTCVT